VPSAVRRGLTTSNVSDKLNSRLPDSLFRSIGVLQIFKLEFNFKISTSLPRPRRGCDEHRVRFFFTQLNFSFGVRPSSRTCHRGFLWFEVLANPCLNDHWVATFSPSPPFIQSIPFLCAIWRTPWCIRHFMWSKFDLSFFPSPHTSLSHLSLSLMLSPSLSLSSSLPLSLSLSPTVSPSCPLLSLTCVYGFHSTPHCMAGHAAHTVCGGWASPMYSQFHFYVVQACEGGNCQPISNFLLCYFCGT